MRELKDVEYMVEIYYPGSIDDIVEYFQTSTPITMRSGELINQGFFENTRSKKLLRIVNIEHIIWEAEGKVKQKACIMTEEVDDTKESRFNL